MRIAFIWQGFDGRYKYQWRDGLYAAMKLIEEDHEVKYFDFPLTGMDEFNPDVVLYWESPCTLRGENAHNYHSVLALPYKKALLFAGGPVDQTAHGFDLYFVESRISEEEFQALGLPWKRAFGVNTEIMRPLLDIEKIWDGILHATFAGWKRHELFADALGENGLAVGRIQDHDRNGYNRCIERGVRVYDEATPESLAELINASKAAVNTAEYWGGGQRCTLEAMACGIPVIVMKDSPKNVEYVQESGGGMIVDPDPEGIRNALRYLTGYEGGHGRDYVLSKWTERHYADSLLEGIASIV